MFFEVKSYDLAGRIGKLVTKHGVLETPYLFPVIDPTRQVPPLDFIKSLGFKGVITNAYLYYKRSGGSGGNIHEYLGWDSVVMTDSGGYQILEYGDVSVDNRTIVEFQKRIGVDIGVILDLPTGGGVDYEEAARRVRETYRRAIEALPIIMDSEGLWALPVQGSPYDDLLIRSSALASRLPYHIYSLGSPTVHLEKYKYDEVVKMTAIARSILPPHKPVHVFGVGHPMIIPFLVALGGDLFDSASYILYARDERYMTEMGSRKLSELDYLPCSCPICSRYGEASALRELPKAQRVEALAKHNLYVLMKEIRTVKQAIKEGRLWELLEYRSRAHPSLREAFQVLKKYRKLLERSNPLVIPSGRAILINDAESLSNPRLARNIARALALARKMAARAERVVLIPAHRKPYTLQREYLEALRAFPGALLLFLHPFLGVIPPELTSTYPFYQHEVRMTPGTISADIVRKFVEKLSESVKGEVIVVESAWLRGEVLGSILSALRDKKVSIYRIAGAPSRSPQ